MNDNGTGVAEQMRGLLNCGLALISKCTLKFFGKKIGNTHLLYLKKKKKCRHFFFVGGRIKTFQAAAWLSDFGRRNKGNSETNHLPKG